MTGAVLLAALATWAAIPPRADRRLGSLFVAGGVQRRLDPVLAVTVLVPVACVLLLGPVLGALVGLGATPAARATVAGLETVAERRRAAALVDQLPTALDLLAAALDAGRPPVDAFAVVADVTAPPLGEELTGIAARLAVGSDPDAVWTHLADATVLGPVGRAFRRAGTSGMPVSRVIGSLAEEMRRNRRAARREQGRRVGVRTAAPLGACFLPAFFLVGIVPTLIGVLGTLSLGTG